MLSGAEDHFIGIIIVEVSAHCEGGRAPSHSALPFYAPLFIKLYVFYLQTRVNIIVTFANSSGKRHFLSVILTQNLFRGYKN